VVSGVIDPDGSFALGPERVCVVLPILVDDAERFAAFLYGVGDNPKLGLTDTACTFCNEPMGTWLEQRGVAPEQIWDIGTPRTLWNARLFPVLSRMSDLGKFMWIPGRMPSGEECLEWLASSRMSMSEAIRKANCGKILSVRDQVRVTALRMRVRALLDGDEDLRPLFREAETRALCVGVAEEIQSFAVATQSPFLKARAFRALSDLLNGRLRQIGGASQSDAGSVSVPSGVLPTWPRFVAPYMQRWAGSGDEEDAVALLWRVFDELAFRQIAEVIEGSFVGRNREVHCALLPSETVVVEVPVRIDLGGGWTDTPPYSLEKGGAVTNVALLLFGKRPIRVTVRPLSEPVIELTSVDIGYSARITRCEALQQYGDPTDPVALHKGALVLRGIVPPDARGPVEPLLRRFGAGIAVESHCDLPKGSGLGTSSLLAIALTAALNRLCGVERAMDDLFQDVLCLEQMLTTGGGWQDQIGGAVGGYKLIRTGPGVSQKPSIQKVDAAHVALKEFDERLVVYYTGAQRLAKNILRVVVGRYLSRDAEVVLALHRLHGVAEDLWSAMGNGDVDKIGAIMNEAWRLNKVLNPSSTAPAIDDLIDGITDLCSGVKLVGAGGGGFLVALAKSRHAAAELRERLGDWSPDGRVYNHEIAPEGLVVTS
jgi:fucokinase